MAHQTRLGPLWRSSSRQRGSLTPPTTAILGAALLAGTLCWPRPCCAEPGASAAAVDSAPQPARELSLAGSAAARGQGPQLDVALALGVAAGGASPQMAPLSRAAGTVIASVLTLGYRWQSLFIGGTVLGALGRPSADPEVVVCADSAMSCQASLFRYGVQVRYYYPLSSESFSPWLGIGFERELFALVNATRGPDALYAQGNQLDLRLGVDVAGRTALMQTSFFVDYAVGSYTQGRILASRTSDLVSSNAPHHWILLGGGLSWRP